MTVIAMTREMGSRGREVALRLAEILEIQVVQHELVGHVAQKMHLRESSVNHLLEGTDSLFERWGVDRSDLSLFTTGEILELAAKGDVLFRGWGATRVLRKVPHALIVRVCASEASRVREIMTRIGVGDERLARREIQRSDAAHTRVMAGIFHIDWREPLQYDLVLNTDRIPVDDCAEAIAALARTEAFTPTEVSRAALADLRLETRIQSALREHDETRRANPSFTASLEPGTGRVTLSGIVFEHSFKRKAVEVVSALPGVTAVVDEMVVPGPAQVGP